MDAEQTIAEIEWLEHIFAVPDTRPMSPSDLSAANRRHDDMLAYCLGFGFGSGMEFAAASSRLLLRQNVYGGSGVNDSIGFQIRNPFSARQVVASTEAWCPRDDNVVRAGTIWEPAFRS